MKQLHVEGIALLPGQYSITWRGLYLTFSPCSGKREPKGYNQHHSIVGCFVVAPTYLDLTPWGSHGNLWGSTTENLTVKEKWGGACHNEHTNLGRLSLYCGDQVVIQTRSLKKISGTLRPENSVVYRSAWFRSSNKEFCQHYSLVCPCLAKKVSHSPTHCGECLPATSNQRGC